MAGHILYLQRKYGVAATIDGITLITAAAQSFKANPTLAAGDVKISKDGGAFANLATLPTVTPAAGTSVQVALSATEMQAARIVIAFIDAAGAEWESFLIIIETFGHASAQFTGDPNNLDATVSSRFGTGNNATVGGYAAGQDPATLCLATPANKLATATGGKVTVGTNEDKNGYALSAAGVDAVHDEVVEGTLSLRQMMRIFLSVLAGKSSGGGSSTISFRDLADTKARITVTTDANGNRTVIVVRDGA